MLPATDGKVIVNSFNPIMELLIFTVQMMIFYILAYLNSNRCTNIRYYNIDISHLLIVNLSIYYSI